MTLAAIRTQSLTASEPPATFFALCAIVARVSIHVPVTSGEKHSLAVSQLFDASVFTSLTPFVDSVVPELNLVPK